MFGGKFGGATTGNVHVDTANNRTIIGIYISGESMIVTKRKKETIAAAVQRKIESEEPGAKLERLDLGSESVSRDAPAAPAAVSMPGRRPRRVLFDPSKYMQPGELARMQGSQTTGRRRGPPHVSNGRPMFGRPPARTPRVRHRTKMYDPSKDMRPGELRQMQGRATGRRIGLHQHVPNGRPMGRPPATTPRVRHRTEMYDPSNLMRPGELARMQGSQTTGRRRGPPHVPNGRPMFGRTPRRRPETPPAAAEECAICLEDLDDASPALACGHKFHAACMRQLAEAAWGDGNAPRTRGGTHVRCPLCQKQMRI